MTWWPVIMQRQFEQFVEFFVPLVQFLDRMMDIPAACRSWYAKYIPVQQTLEISKVQFLVVVDVPVVCNDRCPGLVVQLTVESPQLQFWVSSSCWTRLLCPLVQRLVVAQCLVRRWIHVMHRPGWLLEEFF